MTQFQSRSHRRPPEESMIQESLQLATVELNTRQITRRRSKHTLQHRSTVAIKYRPTGDRKNRSTVVQKIGRMTPTRQYLHTGEYDEDYEEERAAEYKPILYEEETFLHHSSWKRNTPSIDITSTPSIDTQPHQRNRKGASTDIADYPSIDTEVDRL